MKEKFDQASEDEAVAIAPISDRAYSEFPDISRGDLAQRPFRPLL